MDDFNFDEALEKILASGASGETPPEIAGVFADILPVFSEIRKVANAERAALVSDGWDEENAQIVAMDVYGSLLSLVMAPYRPLS